MFLNAMMEKHAAPVSILDYGMIGAVAAKEVVVPSVLKTIRLCAQTRIVPITRTSVVVKIASMTAKVNQDHVVSISCFSYFEAAVFKTKLSPKLLL